MQIPDSASLAELRERDPRAHKMWLRTVKKQLAHQRFMESAQYRMPLRVMLGAQAMMAVVVIAGFGLMGYVAYLGLPWLAAAIGALDLAGIIAVFASVVRNRHEVPPTSQ